MAQGMPVSRLVAGRIGSTGGLPTGRMPGNGSSAQVAERAWKRSRLCVPRETPSKRTLPHCSCRSESQGFLVEHPRPDDPVAIGSLERYLWGRRENRSRSYPFVPGRPPRGARGGDRFLWSAVRTAGRRATRCKDFMVEGSRCHGEEFVSSNRRPRNRPPVLIRSGVASAGVGPQGHFAGPPRPEAYRFVRHARRS